MPLTNSEKLLGGGYPPTQWAQTGGQGHIWGYNIVSGFLWYLLLSMVYKYGV